MSVTSLPIIQHADLPHHEDKINTGYGGTNWSGVVVRNLAALDIHLNQLGIFLAVLLLNFFTGFSAPQFINIPSVLRFTGEPGLKA
jgi:hypothetical protein